MNAKTKTNMIEQLNAQQKRARVRTLTETEFLTEIKSIEKFLRKKSVPISTHIGTCFLRVAGSYKGVPEGTNVYGEKTKIGIMLSVSRDSNQGSKSYKISLPRGYMLRGEGTHPSGAAWDLGTAKVLAK